MTRAAQRRWSAAAATGVHDVKPASGHPAMTDVTQMAGPETLAKRRDSRVVLGLRWLRQQTWASSSRLAVPAFCKRRFAGSALNMGKATVLLRL